VYGLPGNVSAILWIPGHSGVFINFYCLVSLLVRVPLACIVPESWRWLEANGRHDEAERLTVRLERECPRRSRLDHLAEPDFDRYAVVTARQRVRLGPRLAI
jgi:hypothetical protein